MPSIEEQVKDKLDSAHLFVWGDQPPPQEPTAVDPQEAAVYQSVLLREIKDSVLLLAREVDQLKGSSD